MVLVAAMLIMPEALALAQETAVNPKVSMPKPRELTARDRAEISDMLQKQLATKPAGELQERAAGPFRFAGTKEFSYIDRSDLHSLAFENAAYGTANKPLASKEISREVLLPRIDDVLRKSRLDVKNREFAGFQDEFAGATPKQELPRDFDPRKASLHVARTATYERVIDGVPVFGSELVVGLNPDGAIGRLRLHWPRLAPEMINEARRMQALVQKQQWKLPEELKDRDTEILETRAGVGHSGFADPGFRSAAVVRVLFRKTTKGLEHPISSTGYKYFDAKGQEVHFSVFPKVPATLAAKKLREEPGTAK